MRKENTNNSVSSACVSCDTLADRIDSENIEIIKKRPGLKDALSAWGWMFFGTSVSSGFFWYLKSVPNIGSIVLPFIIAAMLGITATYIDKVRGEN